MAAVPAPMLAAAVEALHASRCREPGCLARFSEEQDARTVLEAAAAAAPQHFTRGVISDTLSAFAAELGALAGRYSSDHLGSRSHAIRTCAALARFLAVQARDGLPEEDTGISHCAACHGADLDPDGPSCGHTFGCPEC